MMTVIGAMFGLLAGILCLQSVFEVQMIGLILLISFGNVFFSVQITTLNEVADHNIRNKFQGFQGFFAQVYSVLMICINYIYRDYRINLCIYLILLAMTSPTLMNFVETFYFNKKQGLVSKLLTSFEKINRINFKGEVREINSSWILERLGLERSQFEPKNESKIRNPEEKHDFYSQMKSFFTNDKSKFLIGFCLYFIIIFCTFNTLVYAIQDIGTSNFFVNQLTLVFFSFLSHIFIFLYLKELRRKNTIITGNIIIIIIGGLLLTFGLLKLRGYQIIKVLELFLTCSVLLVANCGFSWGLQWICELYESDKRTTAIAFSVFVAKTALVGIGFLIKFQENRNINPLTYLTVLSLISIPFLMKIPETFKQEILI